MKVALRGADLLDAALGAPRFQIDLSRRWLKKAEIWRNLTRLVASVTFYDIGKY